MTKYILGFILYLTITSIYAQKEWTLEQCVATAIQNNLTIQSADINLRSSAIDLRQANAARLPSLNGDISTSVNLGRTIDPTTNDFVNDAFFSNRYSLNSGVLLYNGGRIKNTIDQAKMSIRSTESTKKQIERDIALNVATLYLNAIAADENIKIAQNNLENAQSQRDLLSKQISAGIRPENEIYNIDAQLAANEQALIAAQNNYTIVILQLRQALMIDPDTPFDIIKNPSDIEITTDPDMITLEELYAAAEKSQKSIEAATYNVNAAAISEDIAKSQLYPTVSLGGFLGTSYSNKGVSPAGFRLEPIIQDVTINNEPAELQFLNASVDLKNTPYADQIIQNLSYGFGLTVNVPIYNNYRSIASVEKSKLNTESAHLNLQREKQTLYLTVQQAHVDAKAAKVNFEATRKALEAQKLAYENAQKRYNLDGIGSFELTNIKTLFDNANINFIIAKYNYIFRTKVLDFYLGKPIKL